MTALKLVPEWERIEFLTDLVSELRKDREPAEDRMDDLRDLQGRVLAAREDDAWAKVTDKKLNQMEYDVLACCLAPEMSPRIAWMYQSLHGRKDSPYPTLNFVQELLNLTSADAAEFYQAVNENAPLQKDRLISLDDTGPFSVIKPGAGVGAKLMIENYTPQSASGNVQGHPSGSLGGFNFASE